jgi:hypothetical protein
MTPSQHTDVTRVIVSSMSTRTTKSKASISTLTNATFTKKRENYMDVNLQRHVTVKTFVGVRLDQLIEIVDSKKVVKRYHEETGEPYDKEVDSKTILLVGKDVTDKIKPEFVTDIRNILWHLKNMGFEEFSYFDAKNKEELDQFYVGVQIGYSEQKTSYPAQYTETVVGSLGDRDDFRAVFNEAERLFGSIGYKGTLEALSLMYS